MFNESDVLNAYFAKRCCGVVGQKPEHAALEDSTVYGNDGEIDNMETSKTKAKRMADFRAGKEILNSANLVVGERQLSGATSLHSDVAPTVLVEAGFIGTMRAYRQVTLILK